MNANLECISSESLSFIPNGRCISKGGFRQIVLSKRFVMRPVVKVERDGRLWKRCTYQEAFEGDFIARMEWEYLSPEADPKVASRIFQVQGDGLVECGDDSFKSSLFLTCFNKVPEFFKIVVQKPTFLPACEAWDGLNSMADLRKDVKIKTFFSGIKDEAWLNVLVSKARTTFWRLQPQRWDKVEKGSLPDRLICRSVNDKRIRSNTNWYEDWVIYHENGEVSLVKHVDDQDFDYGPFPEDVVKAIRITFSNQKRKLATWQLYRR